MITNSLVHNTELTDLRHDKLQSLSNVIVRKKVHYFIAV